jgi:hypothetical protein
MTVKPIWIVILLHRVTWIESFYTSFIPSKSILSTRTTSKLTPTNTLTTLTAVTDPSVVAYEESNPIQIFDNVFSKEACQTVLHELAKDHSERRVSSIFRRSVSSITSSQLETPLEKILDHLLTTLLQDPTIQTTTSLDTSDQDDMYVEYWSRQDHLNLDTHCDIDERSLDYEEDTLKFPSFSHILYLKVTVPKGPTCIWEDETEQWSSHDSIHPSDSSTITTETSTHVPLITIPAVEGRLVRFPGNLFHAVPKPYDRWILSPENGKLWEQSDSNLKLYDDDDDGDDYDDYDDDCNFNDDEDEEVNEENNNAEIRSVLLFNTWRIQDGPPIDVLPDREIYIPDGITLDDDSDDGVNNIPTSLYGAGEWTNSPFGSKSYDDLLRCNPKSEWLKCPIQYDVFVPPISSTMETIHVPLLGSPNRHGYPNPQITLFGNTSTLRKALEQTHNVSRVSLYRT